MIYLEFYQTLKRQLNNEKHQEVAHSIKKKNDSSTHADRFLTEEKFKEGDSVLITGTEIREDGGIWTLLKDRKFPTRGYADLATVIETSCYKTIVPKLLRNFKRIGVIRAIFTILALKWNVKVISEYFEFLFNQKELLLKDEHWSVPVKEIRRVLLKHIDKNIADAIALVIEYDSAYRYRMQDVIENLDKNNLKGFKIVNEIGRLFDILISREPMDYDDKGQKVSEMVKKFRRIKKLLMIAMIFSTQTRKLIRNILQDLDINKVKMSEEDIYWTNQINTYKYRGLSTEDRIKINIQKYGGKY